MPLNRLPDISLWQTFIVAAQTGSFAEAAARLGEDETTVGRRIAKLEHALDTALIEDMYNLKVVEYTPHLISPRLNS